MVRLCSVLGCSTGTVANRKAYREENLKVPSIFSVPKDAERFKQWKNVFPYLKNGNNGICELHFRAEDILDSFHTLVLPNNEFLPRERKTLKPFAVPFLDYVETSSFSVETNIEDAGILEQEGESPNPTYVEEDIKDAEILEQDGESPNPSYEYVQVDIKDAEILEQDVESPNPTYEYVQVDIKDAEILEQDGESPNPTYAQEDASENSEVILGRRKRQSYSVTHIEKNDVLEKRICLQDNSNFKISLGYVIQCFTRMETLPETWSYFQYDKEIHFLSYDYHNDLKRIHLILSDNMSFSIQAQNRTREPTGKNIEQVEDIVNYLQGFNNLSTCVGTKNGRHDFCIGHIPPINMYIRKIKQPRCSHCRVLQKKISDEQSKKLKIRKDIVSYQHKNKLLQLQLKRAKHKISMLEIEIIYARQKCANSDEKALMYAIAELPELKQEATRMCFKVSQIKGKNGMPYNLD